MHYKKQMPLLTLPAPYPLLTHATRRGLNVIARVLAVTKPLEEQRGIGELHSRGDAAIAPVVHALDTAFAAVIAKKLGDRCRTAKALDDLPVRMDGVLFRAHGSD